VARIPKIPNATVRSMANTILEMQFATINTGSAESRSVVSDRATDQDSFGQEERT
jgi:hypothetical protein